MKIPSGKERRRSPRRPIIDTFSLFVVVPKKGMHRLRVYDISDQGIGFDLDVSGEPREFFGVKPQDTLEIHLYLNQSLYLPLSLKVVRIEETSIVRRIGAEFIEINEKPFRAYQAFLNMIDALLESAKVSF